MVTFNGIYQRKISKGNLREGTGIGALNYGGIF